MSCCWIVLLVFVQLIATTQTSYEDVNWIDIINTWNFDEWEQLQHVNFFTLVYSCFGLVFFFFLGGGGCFVMYFLLLFLLVVFFSQFIKWIQIHIRIMLWVVNFDVQKLDFYLHWNYAHIIKRSLDYRFTCDGVV